MDALENVINFSSSHIGGDITFYIICALALVILFFLIKWFLKADKMITAVMHRKKDNHRRDATRVYTTAQKSKASRACGNRCEGTGLFFRCKHTAQDLQGDHWFPHSRGGATTLKNLVMLCPDCNRRKTAHIPTRLQTAALNHRRKRQRGYTAELPQVGEWLPRSYTREVTTTTSEGVPTQWF